MCSYSDLELVLEVYIPDLHCLAVWRAPIVIVRDELLHRTERSLWVLHAIYMPQMASLRSELREIVESVHWWPWSRRWLRWNPV